MTGKKADHKKGFENEPIVNKELEPETLDFKILSMFMFDKLTKPADISRKLNVPHSTINSALKRMQEHGYIKWVHYKGIELTSKGKESLEHLEQHLHLIEIFLNDTLNINPKDAYSEAFKLAPYFSCKLIGKICEKYDQPKVCPYHMGRKIPIFPKCHTHDSSSEISNEILTKEK